MKHYNPPAAPKPKTGLDGYDFSWLMHGYTISVETNTATSQRDAGHITAVLMKDGKPVAHEYRVIVRGIDGKLTSDPKNLDDKCVIEAFDRMKGLCEKITKAQKYLGTFPKVSPTPSPRPPVKRNAAETMRP